MALSDVRSGRGDVRDDLTEVYDTALGALSLVGNELGLGATVLLATRYASASLVAPLSRQVHAVVLARADASPGQLLLLIRELLVAAP